MSTISRQMTPAAEPKPNAPRGASADKPGEAPDIFLTPRVVDTRAFEEFASALRALIDRAGEEHKRLATAASQGKNMREAVEAAGTELRHGLEQTLRASEAFDQRLADANRVLGRVEAMEATLQTLRDSSEELLTARIGELERRIESSLNDAQERLDHIALDRATTVAQIQETIEQHLSVGERRARQLEAQFEARLGELESDRADKFVRLIDAIEARLDEAQGRLTEFDIGLEERLARAQEDAERVFESVERRSCEPRASAEADESLRSRLTTLENLLANALLRVEELESSDRPAGGSTGRRKIA